MRLLLIDRYILRGYLTRFLAWLLVFAFLMLAVQVQQDLDDLVKSENARLLVTLRYFFMYLPYLVLRLVPVASMFAVIGVLGSMARHREVLAMMAGGISPRGIGRAPVLASVLLCGVVFLVSEWIALPWFSNARFLMRAVIKGKMVPDARSQVRLQGLDNRLFLADLYLVEAGILRQVSVLRFDEIHQFCTEAIEAAEAHWEGPEWVFYDGSRMVRSATGIVELASFETYRTGDIPEQPQDFDLFSRKASEMTLGELLDYRGMLRRVGENPTALLPEMGLRLFFPLSCFVMTITGAGLVLRRPTGSFLSSIVQGICVILVYYLLLIAVLRLSHGSFAFYASLVPNVLVGLTGIVLFATARGEE